MSAIRQTIAGSILILYFFIVKKYRPTLKDLALHFMLGFFIFTCANGLTTWAIKYIPSGLGALLGCLFPFFLILLNALIYKEKINGKSTIGLLIGFLGVGLIFSGYLNDFTGENFRFGIIICLIGIFCWTIGTLVSSRQILKGNNLSGIGYQMLFGGLQLFVFSAIVGEKSNLSEIPMVAWEYLIYLIVIGSIVCFLCFMYVLKNLPTDISGVYAYINPIVALILGIIFLNEAFSWNLGIGALVTFFGVFLVKKYSQTVKK